MQRNRSDQTVFNGEKEEISTPWAFGVFLIVCGVAAVVLSGVMRVSGFTDPNDPGPGALPQLIGYILIAGGLVESVRAFATNRGLRSEVSARGQWAGFVVFGQVVLYVVFLPVLGFASATTLFAVMLLRWMGASWKLSVSSALILVAVAMALFTYVFEVILPLGRYF